MKKSFKMSIGIGICTLVMGFSVFSVISLISQSLITTYQEEKLTKKNIEDTQDYYLAEAKANRCLMEIEEIYDIYYSSTSSREDLLEKALKELEGVRRVELGEETKVSYEVKMNEEQSIEVIVSMELKPEDSVEFINIPSDKCANDGEDLNDKKEQADYNTIQNQSQTILKTPTGGILKLLSWKLKTEVKNNKTGVINR